MTWLETLLIGKAKQSSAAPKAFIEEPSMFAQLAQQEDENGMMKVPCLYGSPGRLSRFRAGWGHLASMQVISLRILTLNH
jgi:hypothetical protein